MEELEKIKKETGFEVPENYFEDFSEKMMENIKKENSSRGIIKILRPIISVAAIITIIFAISYFTSNTNNSTNKIENIAQNNYEEDYFSEDLIIDVLSDNYETDTLKEEFLVDYLGDEVPYEDLLAEL